MIRRTLMLESTIRLIANVLRGVLSLMGSMGSKNLFFCNTTASACCANFCFISSSAFSLRAAHHLVMLVVSRSVSLGLYQPASQQMLAPPVPQEAILALAWHLEHLLSVLFQFSFLPPKSCLASISAMIGNPRSFATS